MKNVTFTPKDVQWILSSHKIMNRKCAIKKAVLKNRSLLLTHSLLKSPISKLVISLNNISKGSKNSGYSIAFGGIVKF